VRIPIGTLCWTAQAQGISGGVCPADLFKVPRRRPKPWITGVSEGLARSWLEPNRGPGVADESGEVTGSCDATVPHPNPFPLGSRVYETERSGRCGCLRPIQPSDGDRGFALPRTVFPLREGLANETLFGSIPPRTARYLLLGEPTPAAKPARASCPTTSKPTRELDRQDVHVRWSLMADDQALTCVD